MDNYVPYIEIAPLDNEEEEATKEAEPEGND